MTDPSRVGLSAAPSEALDICFIDKDGNVSFGDSSNSGKNIQIAPATPPMSGQQPAAQNRASPQPQSQNATLQNLPIGRATGAGDTCHNEDNEKESEEEEEEREAQEVSLNPAEIIDPKDQRLASKDVSWKKEPEDPYFTLIWLNRFYKVKAAPGSKGKDLDKKSGATTESERSDKKSFPTVQGKDDDHKVMDARYKRFLENLTLGNYHPQVEEIIWRNLREHESRYETRCRVLDEKGSVCFLKFHTMQVPYLNKANVIVALLHHIEIPKVAGGGYGDPVEHIVAFVLGVGATKIGRLFASLRCYWEVPFNDRKAVGLTTRLFLAAVLKLYGFRQAQNSITNAFGDLETIGDKLIKKKKEAKEESREKSNPLSDGKVETQKYRNLFHRKEKPSEIKEKALKAEFERQMTDCKSLTSTLIELDKTLPGVRSRVHYVGLCAQGLLRDQSGIQGYIRDKLSEDSELQAGEPKGEPSADQVSEAPRTESELPGAGPEGGESANQVGKTVIKPTASRPTGFKGGKSIDQVIKALADEKYKRRDDDKLDMLNRAMQQFEVNIKSLKARANIAIGLVATEYARAQGNFQSLMINHSERDGKIMLWIATITVFALPPTFVAVLLTTPMIQWAKPVVKLMSETSDSSVDTGAPILAVAPFVLWIGLSGLFMVGLLVTRNAKVEEDVEPSSSLSAETAAPIPSSSENIMSSSAEGAADNISNFSTPKEQYISNYGNRYILRRREATRTNMTERGESTVWLDPAAVDVQRIQ